MHLDPVTPLSQKYPVGPGMYHVTRTEMKMRSLNSPHLSGRTRNHRNQTRQGTRLKTRLYPRSRNLQELDNLHHRRHLFHQFLNSQSMLSTQKTDPFTTKAL